MMVSADQYACESRLAQVDPKAKLWFSLLPMVFCLGVNRFASSLICFGVMSAATLRYSSLTPRKYLSFLTVPSGFLLLGTVTVMLGKYPCGTEMLLGFSAGEWNYGISGASLKEGGLLACRAMAAVSCLGFLSLNTPMISLFETLRKSRCPELLVSLMELVYRYVFVVLEEAQRIRTAQASRLGYSGFWQSVRCTGELAVSVFLRALERCDRSYRALESRCWQGTLAGWEEPCQPGKQLFWSGWILCGAMAAASAAEKWILGGGVL